MASAPLRTYSRRRTDAPPLGDEPGDGQLKRGNSGSGGAASLFDDIFGADLGESQHSVRSTASRRSQLTAASQSQHSDSDATLTAVGVSDRSGHTPQQQQRSSDFSAMLFGRSASAGAVTQSPSLSRSTTQSLSESQSQSQSQSQSLSQQKAAVVVRSRSRMVDAGDNQALLDDIDFNIMGAGPSQPDTLREHAALQLLNQLNSADTLFLVRANNYVPRLCDALSVAPSTPAAQMALAAIAYRIATDELTGSLLTPAVLPTVLPLLQHGTAPLPDAVRSALPPPPPVSGRALALPVLRCVAESEAGRAALRADVLAPLSALLPSLPPPQQLQALAVIEHAAPGDAAAAVRCGAGAAVLDVLRSPGAAVLVPAALRALMNLTNNSREAAEALAPRAGELLAVLAAPPAEDRFDVMLLAAGAATNVVEQVPAAAAAMAQHVVGQPPQPALDFLVQLFAATSTATVAPAASAAGPASATGAAAAAGDPGRPAGTADPGSVCAVGAAHAAGAQGTDSPRRAARRSAAAATATAVGATDAGGGGGAGAGSGSGVTARVKRSRTAAAPTVACESPSASPAEAPPSGTGGSPVTGEMENAVLAAYVALLLGCLARAQADLRRQLRDRLPGRSFHVLTQMLVAFLQMHGQAGMLPMESLQTFRDVVSALQQGDDGAETVSAS